MQNFLRVFEGRQFSLDLYLLLSVELGIHLVCEYKLQKTEYGVYEMT